MSILHIELTLNVNVKYHKKTTLVCLTKYVTIQIRKFMLPCHIFGKNYNLGNLLRELFSFILKYNLLSFYGFSTVSLLLLVQVIWNKPPAQYCYSLL